MNLREHWKEMMHPQVSLLTYDQKALLLQGTKTGLAAALSCGLASSLHLHEFYWSGISSVIVLQSNVGSTVTASRDRFIGTAIGASLGFLGSLIGPQPFLMYGITILIGILLCGALNLKTSSRLTGVTITIVMMVQRNGSHWIIALDRFFEVVLGIVVAIIVSVLVFPTRAREHLRDSLAQTFEALGSFFETIMQGFRDVPAENLIQARQTADFLLRTNEQLMRAARHEPSMGPATIESLSLLSEYVRALNSSLLALEIAVRESHGDQFAERVEEEMGRLVQDTKTGFQHVANCAKHWRFDIPPAGISLESDIEVLEAKIAEGRHTSKQVPLEEILRLYAVGLHLKQIARLLRSSRIQLNEAVKDGNLQMAS